MPEESTRAPLNNAAGGGLSGETRMGRGFAGPPPDNNYAWPGQSHGFTLLEVLIALAVVSIAVVALVRATGQNLNAHGELEARTLALWVADNVIAEIRLDGARATGRRHGQARQGGRDWHWELLMQPAPGGELLRADVTVYADPARRQPVLTHSAFLPP